jgi:5-hydroxyisourate hydrolase
VLDTPRGRPAAGVALVLEAQRPDQTWREIARGTTAADGRAETLLAPGSRPAPGRYRLTFDTGAYFAALEQPSFYPTVSITFEIASGDEHYHVPLLLASHGYTTYRGS